MTQIYQDLSWSEEKSVKTKKNNKKVPKLYLSKLNHSNLYRVVGIQTADKHIIYVVCVCICVN